MILIRSPDLSGALLPALWQVLWRDPIARLTAGVFAVFAVLYAAPLLSADQRAALRATDAVDLPFFLLILLACQVGLRRIERPEERRFWKLVTAAYASWMLATLVTVFFEDTLSLIGYYLVLETLIAVYYAILVLAVAAQPHLPSRPRATSPILSWLAIAALIFGLFVYFVLIPVLLHVEAYESGYPSGVLYLLLDAFLAVRLWRLARRAASPRWRRIYSLLSVTVTVGFVNDVQYGELLVSGAEGSWGVPGALLWSLQFVTVALAARLRQLPFEPLEPSAPARRNASRFAEIRERTLAITVVFPVLHFALYASGALDPAIQPARETSMLVWLLLMATVAIVQHRLLEASRQSLEQDTDLLATEISERRELEARRQESLAALELKKREIEDKNAELERFSDTISSDLGAPLAVIHDALGEAESRLAAGQPAQLAEPLRRTDAAAGEMGRRLDDLLRSTSETTSPE